MERRKFEDSWKEAFDQAEISPSENVWTNIELDLEKAKARKLKRRLVFYQLLAAASVVFAMGIGLGVYINSNNPSANEMLATRQTMPSASAPEVASGSEHDREISPDQSGAKQNNASGQRSETDLAAGAASQPSDVSQPQNNNGATDGRSGKENHNIAAKESAGPGPETSQAPSAARREQSDVRRAEAKGNTANSIAQASATDKTQGSALRNKQGLTKEQGITGEEAHVADNATDEERNDKLSAKERGFQASPETALAVDNVHQDKSALLRGEAVAATSEKEDAAAVYPPSFERKLPELVAQRNPELILPQEAEADPVALMLAKLERREQEVREQAEKGEKKEERSKGENLWTSVGVAAGSFNPVVARNPAPSTSSILGYSQFASNASKEMKAKGATYSVGVNMGTRLSDRWVLQGGVNYLTQTSDYTQNGLVQTDVNSNTLKLPSNFNRDEILSSEGDAKQASIVDTPPYNVNNSVRYLSVPMQAGYMLINKGFGLQLNAGVSTDLLLQNNITATVDGEAVDSDYEGSDYRQVNLSGLMGTELSYRFGRRYRLALNPGVRYPFTNIYKSEDFRATRLSFDVGLRFRYIFK